MSFESGTRLVALSACAVAIALTVTTLTPSRAYAQVPIASGHPRIYVRPGDVSALRARAAQPPISTFYNQLRSRMDASTARSSNFEVAGFELESLALLHLIEGGSANRDKILRTWRLTSYTPGQVGHWSLPYLVMAHTIALDWLWNDISATERSQLGNVVVAMMDDLYSYAPYDISWANPMSDYSNQLYYHLGALAFAGIVLAGEGINDTRAAFYLSEADSLLRTHMIPAMNQEAGGDSDLTRTSGFTGNGGWGEDMGHLDMTHPLFGRMVEAWRTGTGQDLFPSVNGLAKFSQYVAYLRRPGGRLSPKGNSSYQVGMSDKNYGTLGALLSARYDDRLGKFIKDTTYTGTTYGFHQLGAVLWYNPALAAPDFSAMPRAMHFQGQGEVVTRSGFGAQDTWVYLRSGPIYNGHQHDDQGNLLVEGYGGEILVENAGNEINHETLYHNSIRIGGDQIPYGNNAVQRAQPLAGTPYERGRVTAFQQNSLATYVATDFSNAYPDSAVAAPKVGKVTREVVTILPDIVVVRDRVAGNGTTEVLFHTWGGSGSLNATTRELSVSHGTGRGWIKTVAPASASAQLVSQGSTDLLTIAAPGTGSTVEFLHVIYLSPANAAYSPANVTAFNDATRVGVSLRDRQGQLWSVGFRPGTVGLVDVVRDGAAGAPAAPRGVRIMQ